MQRLLLGNTAVIKATLTDGSGAAVTPDTVQVIINNPSGSEVELNEVVGNLIYLHSIADNVIGYKFTPKVKGVYKFMFKLVSEGVSATRYLNIAVM